MKSRTRTLPVDTRCERLRLVSATTALTLAWLGAGCGTESPPASAQVNNDGGATSGVEKDEDPSKYCGPDAVAVEQGFLGHLAVEGSNYYYFVRPEYDYLLVQRTLSGGPSRVVATAGSLLTTGSPEPWQLKVLDGSPYWTTRGMQSAADDQTLWSLQSLAPDGSTKTTVTGYVYKIYTAGSAIVLTRLDPDGTSAALERVDATGDGSVPLCPEYSGGDVATTSNAIFWDNGVGTTASLWKCEVSSELATHITTLEYPSGLHQLVVDETHAYWTHHFAADTGIWRIALAGGAPESVLPNVNALNLRLDDTHIYYMTQDPADFALWSIQRLPKNGGSVELIVGAQRASTDDLIVNEDSIWWISYFEKPCVMRRKKP